MKKGREQGKDQDTDKDREEGHSIRKLMDHGVNLGCFCRISFSVIFALKMPKSHELQHSKRNIWLRSAGKDSKKSAHMSAACESVFRNAARTETWQH